MNPGFPSEYCAPSTRRTVRAISIARYTNEARLRGLIGNPRRWISSSVAANSIRQASISASRDTATAIDHLALRLFGPSALDTILVQ